MKDRTMNSASKLHLPGNKLSVCGYGVRKEFILHFSFILAEKLGDISAFPDCRGSSCYCTRTRDEIWIEAPA